jgi:gliding motility-associated-like protein
MFFNRKDYNYFHKTGLLILLLSFFYPICIHAQGEADLWAVGSGKQFNFQSGTLEISEFNGNPNARATICDKDGNLVLYSDGHTVWNSNNEILINGEELIPNEYFKNLPVFIPYPKKEGWYILIYEDDKNSITAAGFYTNTLYYAEINTNAYGGRGEVVSKNIKIHDNYHDGPTIAGYCNNSYFWLVVERNDNVILDFWRDRIYFYKIDENGVSLTPLINDDIDIGNSHGYKFSPNGDKFYFGFLKNGEQRDTYQIVDFDFTNGNLYNLRNAGNEVFVDVEFSPDSRLCYYFSGANLVQVDAGFSESKKTLNSVKTILTLNSDTLVVYPGIDLQLAPDGKIYFLYYEIQDQKTKMGRINNPNNSGDACHVELDYYTFDFEMNRFPDFVTSFFRDKNPENIGEVIADAGPDFEICSGTSGALGIPGNPEVFYKWSPEDNISDPFAASPFFTGPANYGSPKLVTLTLRATDGNCLVNFDTTKVLVLPAPKALPVYGSSSVCPYVEGVDYWTVDDNNTLHWLVDGGLIVSDPANDTIKISWFDPNLNASASVFSTNNYLCNSATTDFPVRINVHLLTETPKGLNKLCIANGKNILYRIGNTNGSVYTWIVDDGEIISGQGSNQIVVNWNNAGQHSVLVQETSVTTDTICFGESLPLTVEIVNDSLEIDLNQVSFNIDNNLVISYTSVKLQDLIHSLFLLILSENGDTIQETRIPIHANSEYIYVPPASALNPLIMQLKVINSCDEVFYSNKQQVIVLKGETSVSPGNIVLSWNINSFWANDMLNHEIWHSENGIDGWEFITVVVAGTEFTYSVQGMSLNHYFRVKQMNADLNQESWSNTIKIELDDNLTIPDVFTPNGDGFNDVWEFRNVGFHPVKNVIVYDKYGQKVFESGSEYIPWDGGINGKIIQGTYLYQITFDSGDIRYGQITVLQ